MVSINRRKVKIESEGIDLQGELTFPSEGVVPLVVLCHGIPLSGPDPADGGYPVLAGEICARGYATLFFNLRGTGDSGGNFSLGGWYRDLQAVMRFTDEELCSQFPLRFLTGFSAGAAISMKYAAEYGGIQGLATFAAPARFSEIFPRENLFSFIELAREVGIIKDTGFPPTPDGFYEEITDNEAIYYVSRVSPIPLLIVHGECDEMVAVEHAYRLFEAAGDPKALSLIPGGDHRLRRDPRILDCLIPWLDRISKRD